MEDYHLKVWKFIDRVAYMNNMSVSALAKKAGLDATSFNKSKRFYPSGQLRWPSTESVFKVIKVMDINYQNFLDYLE